MWNPNSPKITVERIPNHPYDRKWTAYLVRRDAVVVGMLTKWRDTRSTTNPWKAALAVDGIFDATYLGAFYAADGGRKAAITAILTAP